MDYRPAHHAKPYPGTLTTPIATHMKLIVITLPHLYDREASDITALMDAGLETLHLRKPQANEAETASLLRQIPEKYHGRIVVHDHFQLTGHFCLKGIHLNSRHPQPPSGYRESISCSCHSIDEVCRKKASCDYLFLSPIFDSISKQGYSSAFSPTVLHDAYLQGIIDRKVVALGGIDSKRLSQVRKWGFGGVAMLGDIWQQSREQFLPHFIQCLQQANEETDGIAP